MDTADAGALADALTAALHGDEAGFEALWVAFQPALLLSLRVVVGEAAEDVASETWLQAARDLPRFRGDLTGFRVWLFRIGRHRAIDDRRRVRRRAEDAGDPATQEYAPSPRDAAQDALDGLGTAWAIQVVASLPPHQAEAGMLGSEKPTSEIPAQAK